MQTLSPRAIQGRVGGQARDVVVGHVALAAAAERGQEAEAGERGEAVGERGRAGPRPRPAGVPGQTATSR